MTNSNDANLDLIPSLDARLAAASDLDDLMEIIEEAEEEGLLDHLRSLENLPTFGGEEVEGAWSWSETQILWGGCRGSFTYCEYRCRMTDGKESFAVGSRESDEEE